MLQVELEPTMIMTLLFAMAAVEAVVAEEILDETQNQNKIALNKELELINLALEFTELHNELCPGR